MEYPCIRVRLRALCRGFVASLSPMHVNSQEHFSETLGTNARLNHPRRQQKPRLLLALSNRPRWAAEKGRPAFFSQIKEMDATRSRGVHCSHQAF
jgi:hypothetical protein